MEISHLNGYSFVGSGSFNCVFAKDDKVYKIGQSTYKEFEDLQIISMYGLCPPVYEHHAHVKLGHAVFHKMIDHHSVRTLGEYLAWHGQEDVSLLVMARATPLTKCAFKRVNRKDDTIQRALDLLKLRLYRVLGYDWDDDHSGNIGLYNGKLVALDINAEWG